MKFISVSFFFIVFGLLTTIYFSGKINTKQYYDLCNIILDQIVDAKYTDDSVISKTKQGYEIIYKFGTSTKIEREKIAKKIIGYEIMINRDDNAKISEKEFLINLNSPAELNL